MKLDWVNTDDGSVFLVHFLDCKCVLPFVVWEEEVVVELVPVKV